ncbi:hypothetical protein RCH10_005543 [Variovorax sp. GrIS 2.14]
MVLVMADKKSVELADWTTMSAYFDTQCAIDPLQSMFMVTMRLYSELARRQGVKTP